MGGSMRKILDVILPQPPSVNHYTKASQHGGRYLSKEALAFKKETHRRIAPFAPQAPSNNKVVVSIIFCFKDARKRDLDNYLKVTLDSLQGIIFADDSQIDMLCIRRGEKVAGGQTIIKVWERAKQEKERA